MKRPLFFAVSAFALGEVLCQFAKGWVLKGIIVIVMSFFIVLRIKKTKRKLAAYVFVMILFLGMVNMELRGERIDDYRTRIVTCYDDYNISCIAKKQVDEEKSNKEKINKEDIKAEKTNEVCVRGLVCDIIRKNESKNVIISMPHEKVILYRVDYDVKIGETIAVTGERSGFENPGNSGCFDIRKYYISKGIEYAIYNPKIEIVKRKAKSYYRLKQKLYELKYSCIDMLYSFSDDTVAGIYGGLLFGEKDGLCEDTQALYQKAGIAHILAISGLHISLLGMGVFSLFRKLGVMIPASGFLSFSFLFLYGTMTGFGVATLRAIIMLTIYIYGLLLGRTYDLTTSTSAALFVMLILNPNSIYDSGMIISYVAVAGVIVGKYVLKLMNRTKKFKNLRRRKRRIYSMVCSLVISSCINVITIPITIYYYYQIPVYSVIVNILVLSLMKYVVVSGILSVLAASVSIRMSSYFILPGKLVLSFYDFICKKFVGLPHATLTVGKLHYSQVILFYALTIALLILWDRRLLSRILPRKMYLGLSLVTKIKLSVFVLFVLFFYEGLFYFISCREFVSFLDVGQGDAILIRPDITSSIVIDGGSNSDKNIGKNVICPKLKYYGMANVDFWIVSHTDEDHISGLIYILENEYCGVSVDTIVLSYTYKSTTDENYIRILDLAKKRGINIAYVNPGDCIGTNKYRITCLYPFKLQGEDVNHNSLIVSYESKKMKILFTGDADIGALKQIKSDEYDAIKVAHHGSKNSLYNDIYNNCKAAVISCSENNIYNHPHREVVDFLKSRSVDIYRTDLYGEIYMEAK